MPILKKKKKQKQLKCYKIWLKNNGAPYFMKRINEGDNEK